MSGKPSLFSELKRRHVDKVALVYAVVAWLLIELAWILLPTLDAPEWMLPAFIVLVALGFVLVVVTFGHLLKEPLYPFHEHVIPRLALLLFVLLLPSDADRFSLDHLIARRKHIKSVRQTSP